MAHPQTEVADILLQHTTHLSTPKGRKADSGWLADLQRTVYPHKWSPISCRSSAGQRKFACQIPTFYHCATQSTCGLTRPHKVSTVLLSPDQHHISDVAKQAIRNSRLAVVPLLWFGRCKWSFCTGCGVWQKSRCDTHHTTPHTATNCLQKEQIR